MRGDYLANLDLILQPDIDLCMLWAVMLFPNNKLRREQYHLINGTHQLLKDTKISEFNLPRHSLELLLESPSYEDFRELAKKNTKKGIIAGDLLSIIYLMVKFNFEEPSINKAIHVMKEFSLENDVKFGDGARLPRSEQTIRDYWCDFKSVSHLWAAFRLNQSYQISNEFEINEHNYIKFLEVANGLLSFGMSFVPNRQKQGGGLLDVDMWMLPKSLAFRKLEGGEFPDSMEKFLRKYKA